MDPDVDDINSLTDEDEMNLMNPELLKKSTQDHSHLE
jgi:hypothetical protein